MKERILEKNESSFYKINEISLQDRWDSLSDKNRADAFEALDKYDDTAVSLTMDFNQEEILRIVIGFCGRECLKKLLSNSLPTLKAVVWEPDEAFFEAYCTENDISDLISDNRLSIVVGNDQSNLKRILENNVFGNNTFHHKVIATGRYSDKSNPYVTIMVKILEELADEVTREGYSRKKFHKQPCINLLNTIHTLGDNYVISQLLEAIPTRDIPVIIVAAGPSLMKNYLELKRAKNRAVIVSVSHAAYTLFKGGIAPDLVAVTDAAGGNKFLDFDKDRVYTLLCSVWADEHCRKDYNGKIIYHGFTMVNHLFSVDRTAREEFAELDTGSVATDVLSLFTYAGFKRIILIGQDLAYGDDGSTHTDGELEQSVYEKNNMFMEVEGIHGNTVRTRGDWQRFKTFIEDTIEKNKDINFIDATEGGALIRGTDVMSLREAVDKYCTKDYPVDEWICSLKKGDAAEGDHIDRWYKTSIVNLRTISGYLDEEINIYTKVMAAFTDPSLWNDNLNALCGRYDVLYSQIMEGDRGDLLRLYCVEAIQEYVENALILEGDENIKLRMQKEFELFSLLREKTDELLNYIENMVKG